MVESVTLCALALAALSHNPTADQLSTCVEVHLEAQAQGVDPSLMIAMSWHESRFNRRAVSHAGARGAMQVMPRYFCPKRTHKGCNLIRAGVKAFKAWQRRHPAIRGTLCHYNSGNVCRPGGRRYASAVLATLERLRSL